MKKLIAIALIVVSLFAIFTCSAMAETRLKVAVVMIVDRDSDIVLLKQRDQCVLISPQGSLGTLQRGEEEGRDFRNSHDQHTQRPAPLGNSEDGIP